MQDAHIEDEEESDDGQGHEGYFEHAGRFDLKFHVSPNTMLFGVDGAFASFRASYTS